MKQKLFSFVLLFLTFILLFVSCASLTREPLSTGDFDSLRGSDELTDPAMVPDTEPSTDTGNDNPLPENPTNSKKVLFIGNSATSRNEIPKMLSRLASKAGYNVEVNAITKSGATLTEHADATTDHGKRF